MALISVTALILLWDFLDSYEKHSPNNKVAEFTKMLEEKRYEDFLNDCSFEFEVFNNKDEYVRYLKHICDGNITSHKVKDTKEEKSYLIKSGEEYITTLHLNHMEEKNKFGHSDWNVTADDFEKDYEIRLYVPAKANVKINSEHLDKKYMQTDKFPIVQYTEINNEVLIPRYKIFYVDNLLNPPTVMSEYNGVETEFYSYSDGDEYIAYIPADEDKTAEAKSVIEETTKKYTEFSTNHIEFVDLMPYLMEGTELYLKLKTFKNECFKEHTIDYENMSISNLHFYDDTHFSGDISYTYIVDTGVKQTPFNLNYKMSFIKIDDKWKLAALNS